MLGGYEAEIKARRAQCQEETSEETSDARAVPAVELSIERCKGFSDVLQKRALFAGSFVIG